MNRIIDVTGGKGGNAFLLLGAEKAALIDCGMAYCASNLIKNCKHALRNRPLDYICISHSHYDHIGAIPYLKTQWPNSQVLGAEYARQTLNKPNALKLIRSLSFEAAQIYGADSIVDYDDAMMKVDRIICDSDVLELGDLSIRVLETRGHTKCSLSFLIDNDTLFPSESTGYMSKSGKIYPAFLTSCSEAVDSIHKCQKLNPRFIISPHYGLVNERDTRSYWENCLLAVKETKEFTLRLASQGYEEENILTEYEKVFRDEQSKLEQPAQAFRLNARSMIKTVLREEAL